MKVLKCPVCGADTIVVNGSPIGYFVECAKHGHIHNVGTFGGKIQPTEDLAVSDWNTVIQRIAKSEAMTTL